MLGSQTHSLWQRGGYQREVREREGKGGGEGGREQGRVREREKASLFLSCLIDFLN